VCPLTVGVCGVSWKSLIRTATEPPAAWYQYTPNRKGEHPQQHLQAFHGILQADAYGGYGKIYESGRVDEALCWAHYLCRVFIYMGVSRIGKIHACATFAV
jgi:hypothetical protein